MVFAVMTVIDLKATASAKSSAPRLILTGFWVNLYSMQLAKIKQDLQLLVSGLFKVVRCTLRNINGDGNTVYTTKLMIELATIVCGCH